MTIRLIVVLILASCTRIAAQSVPLVERAAWMCDATRSQVRVSPDGQFVGYLESEGDRRQIMLCPMAAPHDVRAVETPNVVLAWFWAKDDRHVLAEVINESGAPSVLAVDVDTGASKVIGPTPLPGARLRVVKVSPRHPQEVVIECRGGATADQGLYRVDIGDGSSRRIFKLDGHSAWYLDDELRVRAARRNVGEGFAIDRWSTTTDTWATVGVYDWEAARVSGALGVNASGSHLFVVDNLDSDKSRLKRIDVDTGEVEVLVEDALADLVPAGVTRDPETGEVTAAVAYFAGLHRHCLDPSLERDFAIIGSVLRDDVSFVGQSRDGQTWLVRDLNGGPFQYYHYDRAKGRTQYLFSDTPSLDGVPMAIREHVVVPARDGLSLPCDLYLPPGCDADNDGRPDEPLPTILYVHGGPWIAYLWNSWFTNRNFQLLANRGYAVVRVEFRGAAGFGRSFIDASNFQFGEAMQTDLLDIRDWLITHGVAAEDRVGIWGWSYGGYATNAALVYHPDAFACGISMYGLSDLLSFVTALNAAGFGDLWNRRVGDPATPEGRAVLEAHSPINFVERLTRPILVTHGAQDNRAPIDQSDRFVEALVNADKPVTYFVYPDEPHDYRRNESWVAFWAIAERFLHEHLGGQYEPYGDDLAGAMFDMRTGTTRIPGLADALSTPVETNR